MLTPSLIRRLEPLIFCYHAISEEWHDPLAVRFEDFERQVRSALRAGYKPVPVEQTVSATGKLLHVTFDDAFRNIREALSLLNTLGVPATVFACTDLARDGAPLHAADLGGTRAAPAREGHTMAWEELRELADSGVEIGSHTCSHPSLPASSDDELRRELRDSREAIEAELGRPCRYLAYPFGDQDARVRAAARAAGYEGAFAQASRAHNADPYSIFRVSIYRDDSPRRVSLKMSRTGRIAAVVRRGRT